MNSSQTPDNKPTSLREILNELHYTGIMETHSSDDNHVIKAEQAIAAYYEALIPEKRPDPHKGTFETGKMFGFNAAIDTIHRNFTGQTDTEREDSRI